MKKIIIGTLLAAVFNYLACTTLNVAEKEPLMQDIVNGKHYSEVYITMNDNGRYNFLNNSYYAFRDTLYGSGSIITQNDKELFKGKLALKDIHHFEVLEVDALPTIGLALGIVAVVILIIAVATFDIGNPLRNTKL